MAVYLKPARKIIKRLELDKDGKVQSFLTNAARKRMDKYVPMDNGYLRTILDIKKDSITYQSPYAHAQYVGYTNGPVKRYTTPGTGTYWDRKMMSAEGDELIKDVQKYLTGGKK